MTDEVVEFWNALEQESGERVDTCVAAADPTSGLVAAVAISLAAK